jgi:hypothetical protein
VGRWGMGALGRGVWFGVMGVEYFGVELTLALGFGSWLRLQLRFIFESGSSGIRWGFFILKWKLKYLTLILRGMTHHDDRVFR